MKKGILSLALGMVFALAILSVSCNKETDPPGIKPINLDKEALALLEADNAFAFDVFTKVVEGEEEGENLMISPLSISLALAMTYNGAEGETRAAMEEVLHLQGLSPDEINRSYKALIHALLSVDPQVVMEIANSIWYREDFSIEQHFLEVNKEYYDAEVSPLDFADPASVNIINSWVSDATHDKIDRIVDQIDPLDVMFLVNAIYFKGTWKYQFDESYTRDAPFYNESGEEMYEVPTMLVTGDFNYMEHDHFKAVELPYGQGNYQMIILLPNTGSSVGDLLSDMDNESWNLWMESFYAVNELTVMLPKFKFWYEKELRETLDLLGMGIAFTSLADFSGINADAPLYISAVRHKTFVEVNEEGTEAAAVTSVTIGLTSIGGSEFIANHPFIFMIREQYTGAIMFMGIVSDPAS